MKNKFHFSLALLLALTAAFAQVPDKTRLDSYFTALEASNKYMGSVAVSKEGKTIYSKTIGYADVETGKKLNATSKFRIGSISKMFTAAMILKAVEEKKLQLSDKLDKYFPTVTNASKITIEQLLSHRSGIHNFTFDKDYPSWKAQTKTQEEMVAVIAQGKSVFEPDTSADYSNSNYVLLGFILEKVYEKPYNELLNDKIVKPLGLTDTYYGGKISTAANEAYSYGFNGKWEKGTETDMSIPGGAGAIVSNATDISRFIEALFAGKVISDASLEKMKTIVNGYGMGMFQFNDKKALGHTGSIDGFSAIVTYFPADKITIAMTSNGVNTDTNDIGLTLLNWVYSRPFDVSDLKTITYTSEELDKYTGNYTSKDIPLGIAITKNGIALMAQATGQGAFQLEADGRNNFKFDEAGIVIEFKPEQKQMVLKQGGASYTFKKE